MSSEQSTDSVDSNGVKMLERIVSELNERLKLTEKQLMKTHRIAVEALRAAGDGPNALSLEEDAPFADDAPERAEDALGTENELDNCGGDVDEVFDDVSHTDDVEQGLSEPKADQQFDESVSPLASQAPPGVVEPDPPQAPPAFAPPAQAIPQQAIPRQAIPAQAIPQQAIPQQPQFAQPQAGNGGASDWESIWLGDQLVRLSGIEGDRRGLVSGLRCGEPAAGVLVGTLLVFRNSTPDRMAQMLKDIGEAYYRWRPETAATQDLFRQALIESLHSLCESASIFNRIELVRPGDRFDSARHHSKSRGGMEVVDVQGWVVLRENGKPYTKANVTVQ